MAEYADGLFAIEVGADDYAETAAKDAPVVPRTFQSEQDFQAQKSVYTAKLDHGDNYEQLLKAVPALESGIRHGHEVEGAANGSSEVKLSKKDLQLLRYAVGELYYDRRYLDVIYVCTRVERVCQTDEKTRHSLHKWIVRCEERVQTAKAPEGT